MAEFVDVSPWLLWPAVVVLYVAAGSATVGAVDRRWPSVTWDAFATVVTALVWPLWASVLFLTPMCRALYRITSGSER